MIETKLILLEGPPGSGKSTTAQKLAGEISKTGKKCQCFIEWSADHPIQIGDDTRLDEVVATSIARENDVLQQWQRFAQAQRALDMVTVMESRFWQTSVMLMYAAGYPLESVLESNRRVVEAIQDLQPGLIFFEIEDQKAFAERTTRVKDAEWQHAGTGSSWAQHVFDAFDSQKWFTERGLSGAAGLVAFLEDWTRVAGLLYDRLPFPKIKIRNPYQDWPSAMRQMRRFLDL